MLWEEEAVGAAVSCRVQLPVPSAGISASAKEEAPPTMESPSYGETDATGVCSGFFPRF